jgi:hypothetical protein
MRPRRAACTPIRGASCRRRRRPSVPTGVRVPGHGVRCGRSGGCRRVKASAVRSGSRSGERELIVRPSHRRAHRYLPSRCACASRRVVQRRRRTGVNAKRSSSPRKVRHRRHYALQSVIGRQRVNASGSEKLTIRPFTGFAYVRHSSSLRAIRNSHSSWSTSFRPWQCLA